MNETAAENYRRRMARVLDHIDRHSDSNLRLEALAEVAAFSKFHFHRQFRASFGIPVLRYVRLSRLKRAAFALAFRPDMSIIEVALAAGFQTPDSFAKVFRSEFGTSPSQFRAEPDWTAWQAAIVPRDQARRMSMTQYSPDDVEIVDFAELPILSMFHHGPPGQLNASIGRFIAWRRENGAGPQRTRTFNIFHPEADDEPRVELACSRLPGLAATGPVDAGTIPGGRCARLRLSGRSDDLEAPATFLYRDWLPASGEQVRDYPLFCERSNFGPGIDENQMVTELYLPLA